MVDRALTDQQIQEGEALIRALDVAGEEVDAAFWLLSEDSGWQLFLHLPRLEETPPSVGYSRVSQVMKRGQFQSISLSDIVVAKSANLWLQLLRLVFKAEGIVRLRFTNNVVQGHLIPDAVVYRMRRPDQGGATRIPFHSQ